MGVLGKGKDEEGAQSNSRKNRKLKKKKNQRISRWLYAWIMTEKKKKKIFAI